MLQSVIFKQLLRCYYAETEILDYCLQNTMHSHHGRSYQHSLHMLSLAQKEVPSIRRVYLTVQLLFEY